MSEVAIEDEICRVSIPGGRWLATGVRGGYTDAETALNLTVPTGFDRRDLQAYVESRCERAGIDADGPALLTAVDQAHARGARAEDVLVVATAGLSNPASLPVAEGAPQPPTKEVNGGTAEQPDSADRHPPGTVNLLVATDRHLDDSALASALATAVEAKTATVLSRTGFTGTTTDAVAVGTATSGERAAFVGSGTGLGVRLRACVRDAIGASLDAYYAEREVPDSVRAAENGRRTTAKTDVFEP